MIFSIILSETFVILRIIQRDVIINEHKFSCTVLPLLLADFNETGIFSKYFRKKSPQNIKFRENPSSGSRVVPCGRTDRQDMRDKANNRFV